MAVFGCPTSALGGCVVADAGATGAPNENDVAVDGDAVTPVTLDKSMEGFEGFVAAGFKVSLSAETEEGAPKLNVAPDACALDAEAASVVAAAKRGLLALPKKESDGAVGEGADAGFAGTVGAAGLPNEAAGAFGAPQGAEDAAGAAAVLPNG